LKCEESGENFSVKKPGSASNNEQTISEAVREGGSRRS
jgi:hypothetical protein